MSLQNKGLKRYFQEEQAAEDFTTPTTQDAPQELKLNSISGSKRRRLALIQEKDAPEKSSDPNVVGFDSSGSEVSEDEQEEIQPDEVKTELTDYSETNGKAVENDEVVVEVTENQEKVEPAAVIERKEAVRKPAVFVTVDRKPSIQKARLKLPVLAEEQQIMEKINESCVVILAGETGNYFHKELALLSFFIVCRFGRTRRAALL